jgi:hypothetical protein
MTFAAALNDAREALRVIGTGALAEELVKEGPRTYSRKVHRDVSDEPKPDPSNYLGVNWSEVG